MHALFSAKFILKRDIMHVCRCTNCNDVLIGTFDIVLPTVSHAVRRGVVDKVLNYELNVVLFQLKVFEMYTQ